MVHTCISSPQVRNWHIELPHGCWWWELEWLHRACIQSICFRSLVDLILVYSLFLYTLLHLPSLSLFPCFFGPSRFEKMVKNSDILFIIKYRSSNEGVPEMAPWSLLSAGIGYYPGLCLLPLLKRRKLITKSICDQLAQKGKKKRHGKENPKREGKCCTLEG